MHDISMAFALLWACCVVSVLESASWCGTLLCWLSGFLTFLKTLHQQAMNPTLCNAALQRPPHTWFQMSKPCLYNESCPAALSDLTGRGPRQLMQSSLACNSLRGGLQIVHDQLTHLSCLAAALVPT